MFTGERREAVFVLGHSGEFLYQAVDLRIPGRGFDFEWKRTYRSQNLSDGPLGSGWRHSYQMEIVIDAKGVTLIDGEGRTARYEKGDGAYISPPGHYTRLLENENGTFTLRKNEGTLYEFDSSGRLRSISDRNRNHMSFQYDPSGRLIAAVDTMGRSIDFHYTDGGRLQDLTDFSGRTVSYAYVQGSLASVTGPAVTGTPNQNDFPLGKTTRYDYELSSSLPDELRGNLTGITAPNESAVGGPPRIVIAYGTSASDFDRVVRLEVGGINAGGVVAGGTHRFVYESLNPGGDPNDLKLARRKLLHTDRAGNLEEHFHNRNGHLVLRNEFTRGLRQGDPAVYATRFEYNPDGEITRIAHPEGNEERFVYDSSNPDRFQQGNLLESRMVADLARGGDGFGSTLADQVTTYLYEPLYNQIRSITDARGNDPAWSGIYTHEFLFDYQEGDPADNGVQELADRFKISLGSTPLGLGDLNRDGLTRQTGGNLVLHRAPAASLREGSRQAEIEGSTRQQITTLYQFNNHGQQTAEVDAEGNRDEWHYYSESDPDGDGTPTPPAFDRLLDSNTGGYLKERILDTARDAVRNNGQDPEPARISTTWTYDEVGNAVSETNGRGIRTNRVFNQLNQIVEIRRAADVTGLRSATPREPIEWPAPAYLERIAYDFNNNIVLRQTEDRVESFFGLDFAPSQVGANNQGQSFVDHEMAYDILDQTIERRDEVDDRTWMVSRTGYDPNGNVVLTVQPEGNATATLFDERDLPARTTEGWSGPRGGAPAATTYSYDGNRNLVEMADAEDTDLSAANNGSQPDSGDATRFIYDGRDRKVREIDPAGGEAVWGYDSVDNTVVEFRRGRPGGATPIDSSGLGNVDLSRTDSHYDEMNRLVQVDRHLFVPDGVVLERPALLADGNLSPGDQLVTTRNEYDRLGRLTFSTDDDSGTVEQWWDGADRLIRKIDSEGNKTGFLHDDNHNVIEVFEVDSATIEGVPEESFVETRFYDPLDRLSLVVDNLEKTRYAHWDSRGNQVLESDAAGEPVAGFTLSRRVLLSDPFAVNGLGNLTRFLYDGADRLIRVDKTMAAGVADDGLSAPQPDPGQAGDGFITTIYGFDRNGLLDKLTDDNGNETTYAYDNLNRLIQVTEGQGESTAEFTLPATIRRMEYDRDGNTIRTIDENGTVSHSTYDALNRVIEINFERAGTDVAPLGGFIPLDVLNTTLQQFEYDGLGRIRWALDNNDPIPFQDDVEVVRAYDSLGRQIEERIRSAPNTEQTVRFGWSGNHRTSLTYPDGRLVLYAFDSLGRVGSIADDVPSAFPSTLSGPIMEAEYIGPGRVLERRFQNGRSAEFAYDRLRRLSSVVSPQLPLYLENPCLGEMGDHPLAFDYGYDTEGNRIFEDRRHAPSQSELYSYDSASRLNKVQKGCLNREDPEHSPSISFVSRENSWTLDGVGNWRSVLSDETVTNEKVTKTFSRTNFNQHLSTDASADDASSEPSSGDREFELYVHDRRGSLALEVRYAQAPRDLLDFSLNFSLNYYDASGRLVRVLRWDGTTITKTGYRYDVFGRRIGKKTSNPSLVIDISPPPFAFIRETIFSYDEDHVIQESDGSGTPAIQYVFGGGIDQIVAVDRWLPGTPGKQRLFYHLDGHNNVVALSDFRGWLVQGYQYDAYGNATVCLPGDNGRLDWSGDDILFPAEMLEEVSEPLNSGAFLGNPYLYTGRRFDPETGNYFLRSRYLDPGQGRFISKDPIGFVGGTNLYEYTASNPVSSIDPYGFKGVLDYVKSNVRVDCCKKFFKINKKFPKNIKFFGKKIDLPKKLRKISIKAEMEGCVQGECVSAEAEFDLKFNLSLPGLKVCASGEFYARKCAGGRLESRGEVCGGICFKQDLTLYPIVKLKTGLDLAFEGCADFNRFRLHLEAAGYLKIYTPKWTGGWKLKRTYRGSKDFTLYTYAW